MFLTSLDQVCNHVCLLALLSKNGVIHCVS